MTTDRPLGKQEIADLLGYPRETVYQWVKRNLLPPPDGHLSGQGWWWETTIREWAARTDRDRRLSVGNPAPVTEAVTDQVDGAIVAIDAGLSLAPSRRAEVPEMQGHGGVEGI